jgi:hypothetical protein
LSEAFPVKRVYVFQKIMRHELREDVEEFLKYAKRVNQNPHVDTIGSSYCCTDMSRTFRGENLDIPSVSKRVKVGVDMYDRLEDMVCEIRNRISDGKVQI